MNHPKTSRESRSGTTASMRESIKKAVGEMIVLFLLRQRPMYVYEMAQEVAQMTKGRYIYHTLYVAIYRLQEHGHITEAYKEQKGNRVRVYFKLTDAGQQYLDDLLISYREMTGALDDLLLQDGKM